MKNLFYWRILKHFSSQKTFWFSLQDVARAFPEKNHNHLSRVLTEMSQAGMLYKVTRGLYHIIPLDADPETYQPAGLSLAAYLMRNKEYYLGYSSALSVLGIGESKKIYIVTRKQEKSKSHTFGIKTLRFVYQEEERFFGYSECWLKRKEKIMVSDLEKTIVDMATNPGISGGIPQLAHALFQAGDRINTDKLLHYLTRNLQSAAKKRILYLTELLNLEWTPQHEKMRNEFEKGSNLLDPTGAKRGESNPRFKLKINMDPDLIKQQSQSAQL